MILSLLLLQTEIGSIERILNTFGFPVALALGLLWFAYKVWVNQSAQLKDKDILIQNTFEKSESFRIKLIESQDKINTNQEKTFEAVDSLTDVMKEIKSVLQTQGK